MHSEILGIDYNPVLLLLWSFFVGLVFSTVGAAGGILSGVGHISIFGIHSANNIKIMNQILVISSTLISVPSYFLQKRVVYILSFLLGIGSIAGALIGSTLSYRYLPDVSSYKPVFGLFTLLVSLKIFQEIFLSKSSKERIKGIEQRLKEKSPGGINFDVSPLRITFRYLGETYSFSTFSPLAAGFVVAVVSSALGVGGGFLLVPFMVSFLRIPMFLVPGTSALSILITMVVSIGNYVNLGSRFDPVFLGIEVVGVMAGSFAGPHLSRKMGEKKLRLALGALLMYIGIRYLL